MKPTFICHRGHITLANQDDSPLICCPQIERSNVHPNKGKVCGRLSFRFLDISDVERTITDLSRKEREKLFKELI